jgi:AcrR family transcriptional regulator
MTGSTQVIARGAALQSHARDRIMGAAYELFSRHGVHGVGIDAVIKRAGVARMTLYRHFRSKEQLVLEFMAERERQWAISWLEAEVRRREHLPTQRLLGIFDVFHDWFQQESFEGCPFVTILLETAGEDSRYKEACVEYLARIRTFLESLAVDAGIADSDDFARKWHMLMKGSIVAATEGDSQAARRAREIGAALLPRFTPQTC